MKWLAGLCLATLAVSAVSIDPRRLNWSPDGQSEPAAVTMDALVADNGQQELRADNGVTPKKDSILENPKVEHSAKELHQNDEQPSVDRDLLRGPENSRSSVKSPKELLSNLDSLRDQIRKDKPKLDEYEKKIAEREGGQELEDLNTSGAKGVKQSEEFLTEEARRGGKGNGRKTDDDYEFVKASPAKNGGDLEDFLGAEGGKNGAKKGGKKAAAAEFMEATGGKKSSSSGGSSGGSSGLREGKKNSAGSTGSSSGSEFVGLDGKKSASTNTNAKEDSPKDNKKKANDVGKGRKSGDKEMEEFMTASERKEFLKSEDQLEVAQQEEVPKDMFLKDFVNKDHSAETQRLSAWLSDELSQERIGGAAHHHHRRQKPEQREAVDEASLDPAKIEQDAEKNNPKEEVKGDGMELAKAEEAADAPRHHREKKDDAEDTLDPAKLEASANKAPAAEAATPAKEGEGMEHAEVKADNDEAKAPSLPSAFFHHREVTEEAVRHLEKKDDAEDTLDPAKLEADANKAPAAEAATPAKEGEGMEHAKVEEPEAPRHHLEKKDDAEDTLDPAKLEAAANKAPAAEAATPAKEGEGMEHAEP